MPYTQTELLAGFLAASCLILLWCWYQKKQSYEGLHKHIPGLRMRSGMHGNVPGLSLNKRRSYVRNGMEGLDAGPVASMNDMEHAGNLSGQKAAAANKAVPMVEAKWQQDMSVPLDLHAATDRDVDADLLAFGNELDGVDRSVFTDCDMAAVSLGGEILAKTDYEPEYSANGARGSVTF
jgi:hypothetical protein